MLHIRSGDFVPKAEIHSRLKAADERNAISDEIAATSAKRAEDASPDTEGLQATVSLSLNFLRQVKRPLQKVRSANGGDQDEQQLAQIAETERDMKKEIHSRLVRTQFSAVNHRHSHTCSWL